MNGRREQFDPLRELERLKDNPKATAVTVGVIVGAIVVIWFVLSSYYTVAANERAVVLRFGKDIGTSAPGLHFKLPFGIDRVLKAAVKEKKREEFGFRTRRAGVETSYYRETPSQKELAQILTGDLNIVDVKWVVRYRIKDLRNYFFNITNPESTLRDVSEAAMRMVVGDSSVDEVLTIGRNRIQQKAKQLMQEKFDGYGAGLHVVNVRLKDVAPPEEVKDAFNAVNQAKQKQEQIINEAEKQRNTKIPEAKGKKLRVIQEAKGYAKKRVNEAEGETARFLKLYELYNKAPEVTMQRLYLESLEKVLEKVENKYVLDSASGDVFKFLNLGELTKGKEAR